MMTFSLMPSFVVHIKRSGGGVRWLQTWVLKAAMAAILSQCTIHTTVREIPLRENEILVHDGDSLYSIAAAYNVDVRQLMEKNGLSPQSLLTPNQKLVLPARRAPEHTPSAPLGSEDLQTPGPQIVEQKDDSDGGWVDVPTVSSADDVDRAASARQESQGSGLTAQQIADGVKPMGKLKGQSRAVVAAPPDQMSLPESRKIASKPKVAGPWNFQLPVDLAPSQTFSADHPALTFPTKPGTPVRVAEAGRVLSASSTEEGGIVIVLHQDPARGISYCSAYLPVSPDQGIQKGAILSRGQVLGRTEAASSGQLTFEMRDLKRKVIDPLKLIKGR